MIALSRSLKTAVFLIPEETSFERRGFSCTDESARTALEGVGAAFCDGYNAALRELEPAALNRALDSVANDLRGFAFEGAGMALSIFDLITPWRRDRWSRVFVEGDEGPRHIYMALIGTGWALARLKRRIEPAMTRLDPVLGWLVADGYGFHEAFFHPDRTVVEHRVPKAIQGYARRVFDQGVGRSLWFINGADANRIAETISRFDDPVRQSDLWSGIGLATTYAGGVDESALHAVRAAAADYLPELAQGSAFAAKARIRAGLPNAHTERATRIICGLSADDAAAITDTALEGVEAVNGDPAYQVWRTRIQKALLESGSVT